MRSSLTYDSYSSESDDEGESGGGSGGRGGGGGGTDYTALIAAQNAIIAKANSEIAKLQRTGGGRMGPAISAEQNKIKSAQTKYVLPSHPIFGKYTFHLY